MRASGPGPGDMDPDRTRPDRHPQNEGENMLVFLKGAIYPPAVELLKQHAEVTDDLSRIAEVDGMVIRGFSVTADIIDAATNLKVIAKHGIGVNNIDVEAATRRGIPVVNTPLSNADSVAELTVGLILLLERNLYQANVSVREGVNDKSSGIFRGTEIKGKIFGQIGMGNIAQRIGHIMGVGFGCHVLGYDPFIDKDEAERRGFEKVDTLEELLERSDIVNVNVPLTKGTTNMISREMMQHFKPGSVFINAARGAVIDEDALYDALTEGRLKAAACDTFIHEPISPDHPLLKLPNFSGTPHIGGNTVEALQKTGMEVVESALKVLNGDFNGVSVVNKVR